MLASRGDHRADVNAQAHDGRFETLVLHTPDLMAILQLDGTIAFLNLSARRILGYDPRDLLGSDVFGFIHPSDVAAVQAAFGELSADAQAAFDCRFRHANGSWVCLESFGSAHLEDPAIAGIIVSSRDITQRRRAEEALAVSAARYRTLLEQTPAIVYRTSLGERGDEFYVNPQIENALGFSQEEWTDGPRLWLNRLHPQDRMRVLSELAHSYDRGAPLSTEYRLLARNGQVVWFHDEALIVTDDDGRPVALQGVRMDVTERKRAEEALHRNLEERLAAEEALHQRNLQLELLNRATQALSSTLELQDVLSAVLEEMRNLLGVAASSIWLIDPNTGELVCQQATGSQSDALRGWRLSPGQGIAGWVVHNDESLIVDDVRSDERHFRGVTQQTGLEMRSILAAPMRATRGAIGVLQVLDTQVDRFSATDLVLLGSLSASAASVTPS